MKLYHFTDPELVPLIREHGLIPRAIPRAEDDFAGPGYVSPMTNGRPVVWLTAVPDEWNGTRLSVRLESNSKRLQHFMPWCVKFNPHIYETKIRMYAMTQGHTRCAPDQWFVYLGTISPGRIEEAVPQVEWNRKDAA